MSLPTVDKVKEDAEALARTAFCDREDDGKPCYPQALTYDPYGATTVIAFVDLTVVQAFHRLRRTPCSIAVLLVEAYGESKNDDIVAMSIDHPNGIHRGRLSVDDTGPERALGAVEWAEGAAPSATLGSNRIPGGWPLVGIRVLAGPGR